MSAARRLRAARLLALAIPAAAVAQTTATPPASPATGRARDPDKVICHSTTQIGSLVATDKVCKTRREWDRERDNLRERGPVGNCPGGAQGGSCG